MKYIDCIRFLAKRRTDQLVVTSAGNSGQAWWAATADTEATFYLDASMSLSTMFASGLALALPEQKIWTFMGDGAFCMNPGALMVERDLDLPNLTHFLISNRRYGATGNAGLPNQQRNDYAAIARGMGLAHVFSFDSIASLESGFDNAVLANTPRYTFVVLEVEPFTEAEQKLPHPPFEGPEMKFRFGRHVERLTKRNIFGYEFKDGHHA
ncbi:MAG TPA: thiamine pyrophosphate-dependent enzyme [Stellaceae bacterium]|nr:thiamine pyrophosphate-dependent enzyme [Stellaceae bacterium]